MPQQQEIADTVHARPVRATAAPRPIGPQARRIRPAPAIAPRSSSAIATDPGRPGTDPRSMRLSAAAAHSPALPAVPPDLRRVAAAGLSAIVPGLGQLLNGRPKPAAVLLVPTLLVAAVAGLVIWTSPPLRLAAAFVAPRMIDALLTLSAALLAWRLIAVGQAFFDRRYARVPGRLGIGGLAVVVALVVLPHAAAAYYGGLARDAFGRFFGESNETGAVAGAVAGPGPGAVAGPGAPGDGRVIVSAPLEPRDDERLNILLVGVDTAKGRSATLTDTMMVASLDRRLGSLSLVSIPRDLVNVPLGDGRTFEPKLNSLYGYASRHRAEFPKGPMRTLEDAVGELLGIRVHYQATLDFAGFADMIDAVGGVEVTVRKGFEDPDYDGIGLDGRGWSITAGRHHLDGANALAYARSRKALGESDFTRQERQQQILVAFRDRLLSGGSLFFGLPKLLDTFGGKVRTDLPPDRLPELAALADTAGRADIVRVVIQRPLIKPTSTRYGSVQVPVPAAIRDMTARVLPAPGTPAAAWPAPKTAVRTNR